MTDLDMEKQKFFVEGAKNYFNARRAIKEYESMIQQEIKVILESKRNDLEEALDQKIEDAFYPQKPHRNEWYGFGIEFSIPECATHYVIADIRQDGLYAFMMLGMGRPLIDRFQEIFQQEGFSIDYSENEIYIEQKIDPADIQVFREKIRETIDSWEKFWKKVKGTRFLKDAQQ